MLIRDRLDAAFETEPPEVPVTERLAAGKSALRRRRFGQGALSVAAVTVICTGAVAIVGGGTDSRDRLDPTRSGVPATTSTPDNTNPSNADGNDSAKTTAWPYPG